MNDGENGGMFYVDPSTYDLSVAANIVDQDYWFTTSTTGTINGCPPPAVEPQFPGPFEVYGNNNFFYNNEAKHSSASGMNFGAGTGNTYNITVSGSNPWNPSDPARYIHNNYFAGIWFYGSSYSSGVSGVALSGARICNTGYTTTPTTPYYYAAPFGSDGILFGYTSGTGFINGATMSNNYPANTGGTYNLTNGPPGNPTTCPAGLN
jgi:hypothetical protein